MTDEEQKDFTDVAAERDILRSWHESDTAKIKALTSEAEAANVEIEYLKSQRSLDADIIAFKSEIATLTTQRDAYKKGMDAQTRQCQQIAESLRKLRAGEKPQVVR